MSLPYGTYHFKKQMIIKNNETFEEFIERGIREESIEYQPPKEDAEKDM